MKLLNTKIKDQRPTAFLSGIKDLATKYTNVTTVTLASTMAPKACFGKEASNHTKILTYNQNCF